jgi:hypothetical protein
MIVTWVEFPHAGAEVNCSVPAEINARMAVLQIDRDQAGIDCRRENAFLESP